MENSKNNSYDKYINEGQCAPYYEALGLCHTYFFKKFNSYPSIHSIKDKYIEDISKFHDPILTYVAIYLYHNYGIAYEYFKPNETGGKTFVNKAYGRNYNTACAVLNTWLDQEKNFYTNFGSCHYNLRWWNIYIEPLWEELKKKFPNKICERYHSYYYKKTSLKKPELINNGCYQQEPENHVCYKKVNNTAADQNDDVKSLLENCPKLSILFYLGEKHKLLGKNSNTSSDATNEYCKGYNYEKINYNPVLKAEKFYFCESLISIIALPITVTVLGTIFLAFFLNEFTPIGSILGTRTKNKIRLRDQFNEEGYKEYQKFRNNNQKTDRERNIIYYQSMSE